MLWTVSRNLSFWYWFTAVSTASCRLMKSTSPFLCRPAEWLVGDVTENASLPSLNDLFEVSSQCFFVNKLLIPAAEVGCDDVASVRTKVSLKAFLSVEVWVFGAVVSARFNVTVQLCSVDLTIKLKVAVSLFQLSSCATHSHLYTIFMLKFDTWVELQKGWTGNLPWSAKLGNFGNLPIWKLPMGIKRNLWELIEHFW